MYIALFDSDGARVQTPTHHISNGQRFGIIATSHGDGVAIAALRQGGIADACIRIAECFPRVGARRERQRPLEVLTRFGPYLQANAHAAQGKQQAWIVGMSIQPTFGAAQTRVQIVARERAVGLNQL